jgi:hypothetical protein
MTPIEGETATAGLIAVAMAPYILQAIKMLRTQKPAPRGTAKNRAAPGPLAAKPAATGPRPVADTEPLERAS